MLHVGVFAVTDEAAVRQRRIGRFKVDLVVRIDLLLNVEVKAVGVVAFIGDARHHAELCGVEAAKAVAEVFARRAVKAEAVAGFRFPGVGRGAQTRDNLDPFGAQRGIVIGMARAAAQRVQGFMQADIAQRQRGAPVAENRPNLVIGVKPYAAGALHVEDRRHARFGFFQAGDSRHQRALRQRQPLVEQRPEARLVALRLQRDARQIEADDPQIVAAVVNFDAVFLIDAEKAAAAHRRFKRAGDFYCLVVVKNIGVHALAGALQRQLFDIVVDIARTAIEPFANREDQLGKDGGLMVFAQPGDAVAQDRLLDKPCRPAGAEPEAEGDERRLAVGGVQRVDLVLQRLKGVVALFLGACPRVGLDVGNLPFGGDSAMLFHAELHKGRQHLVDAVNGGAAVNMAGDLGDNLRGDRRGGGDRLRRLDLGVAHLEAVGEHAFQIDQHTVEHGEERGVVEIVIVDLAALVRLHHVARQQLLLRIMFRDDARQQVALRRDHLTVFIGVFVQQRGVGLIDQAANGVVQLAALLARYVAIVTIFDIGARQLRIRAAHQRLFNRELNIADIHFGAIGQLLADALSHRCAPGRVVDLRRARRSGHRRLDSCCVKL